MPKTPKNAADDSLDNLDDVQHLDEAGELDEDHGLRTPGYNPTDAAEFNRVETPVEILTVMVDRGPGTKIASTIFAWELPILEEIHGDDSVEVVEERDGVTTQTAAEAHRQLLAKYSSAEHRAMIKSLYRNAGVLAKRYKLPFNTDDNRKGMGAPPAIDFSRQGSPELMGSSEMADPATTRRV